MLQHIWTSSVCPEKQRFSFLLLVLMVFVFGWVIVNLWLTAVESIVYETLEMKHTPTNHFLTAAVVTFILVGIVYIIDDGWF